MTPTYEALIIVSAAGTDADVARVVAQVEEPIKKLGGTIAVSKGLGRRRLAYRIAKQPEGYYQLLEFSLPASQVEELKRLLRLNETVIRFLILNRSGTTLAAAGVPQQAGAAANRNDHRSSPPAPAARVETKVPAA